MEKILVTGGAGYVGSCLISRLLNKGYEVICIDKLMFGGEALLNFCHDPKFTFYNVDLLDFEKVDDIFKSNKIDAVFHLAAIVGDPACKAEPELATKVNLDASKFLLDSAIRYQVSKFIFASTCSNYGKAEGYVDESNELAPVSLYAELKVAFERYLMEKKTEDYNFTPTVLRFATVYGLSPRMRFDLTVNEFTKALANEEELVIYGEQFWRPYCHVRDFANAFTLVLESKPESVSYEVFNVGDTQENYTKKMLADELLKAIPEANISYVDKKEDPRDYRVNCDKIKSQLGFKITKTVPQGIAEILSVIRSEVVSNTEDKKYYNT
ncbi:epimerase [Pseudoalteromonas sp. BMB]|uniref:NAD-dependent epimerase/dehydratase family protein n=1 Tax=Pseudoalteromonas sp. BMB TaxID=1874619 RepID=UPI00083D11D0|nr:NAD(P)-dependent oxidoreductase [Pseudoalteromonas sp. BMB]ODB35887.1 epimerase [Pseudoalteromonas sp. BMB]